MRLQCSRTKVSVLPLAQEQVWGWMACYVLLPCKSAGCPSGLQDNTCNSTG